MAVASQDLTLDEFLRLPEEKPALEYVDGVVGQKVSPKLHHGIIQTELAQRVNAAARPGKVAAAVTEVRATFGGQSVVPDVSVFRWDRIPRKPSGEASEDVFIPPDIAIEIVSPSQSVNAMIRRCRWYVASGVEIALLVDPADRSVLAFLAGGVVHEWRGEDRIDLDGVVPGLALRVEEL